MIGREQKLKRAALWAPARLYELGVRLRVAAYETRYLKQKRLGSTVIGIGNITLGGTGKTPFVEYVASYLNREDQAIAILTRGYGRKSTGRRVLNDPREASVRRERAASGSGSNPGAVQAGDRASETYREFGDEPLMLARALPEVPVVIADDRYEAGLMAERELGAEVLVLDDAFQHLRLARDLNLLLIDATDPFGGLEMVPFGRLREPLFGLKRADAVIITRADKPFDQAETLGVIKEICGEQIPVMYFYSAITEMVHLATERGYDPKQFAGWNAAVLCGIANPQAFSDDLLQIGINIVSESFFDDHHPFTQGEVDDVARQAREAGADAIVTTAKDAVRLEGLRYGDVPVYAARVEIQGDDEVRFRSLLLRTVVQKR